MIWIKPMGRDPMANLDVLVVPPFIVGFITWVVTITTFTTSSGDLSATVNAAALVGAWTGGCASFAVIAVEAFLWRSRRKLAVCGVSDGGGGGPFETLVTGCGLLVFPPCFFVGVGFLSAALAIVQLARLISLGVLRLAHPQPAKTRRADMTGGSNKARFPGSVYGRLIALASKAMAPQSRQRWLDSIDETLHDFEPAQHRVLLRDFLIHAAAVAVHSWTTDRRQHVPSSDNPQERGNDRPGR